MERSECIERLLTIMSLTMGSGDLRLLVKEETSTEIVMCSKDLMIQFLIVTASDINKETHCKVVIALKATSLTTATLTRD